MARTARHDRDATLDRAVDLFWRQGYHATSLKDLERVLDMRPGSIYAAFDSKAGLFGEALSRYADGMLRDLAAILNEADSPLTGLRRYLRTLGNGCAEAVGRGEPSVRACMLVKTLLEVGADDGPLGGEVNRLLDGMETVLADTIAQAQAVGEIDPAVDARRLARLLQAQIIGLRSFAQRRISAETVSALTEDVVRVLDSYAVRET